MTIKLGNTTIAGATIQLGQPLNIGQIVQSTLPLTDAGLHLLDGALIQGSGIYSAFVDYIAGLVTDYPNLFCTEADWQSAVNTYGVCGKFVYDSVNNTVRLPKITGILEGTTDVTALGDLVQAGLPNITGSFGSGWEAIVSTDTGDISASGLFANSIGSVYGWHGFSQYNGRMMSIKADASLSNSIYGNSSTVQPQTIKCYYYIVIATATKTDIEVDIDQVITDLNGKADVDLTNCTKPHIVSTYSNGSTHYRIYSDGWCEESWHANSPSTINTTLALPIPFKDTDYTVIGAVLDNDDLNICGITAYPATPSTFYALTTFSGIGYSKACTWYACGYVS